MERNLIVCCILAILCLLACGSDSRFDNALSSDREALIDFKHGLEDPNDRLSSWKGSNYCHWHGITCENDTKVVVSIDLHNPYSPDNAYEDWSSMSLSGEIRPSLVKLKSLKYLDLSLNSFEDIPIPPFFGSLKNLQYLNLSYAGFSGVISSNLGNLSNLQYLDISSNDLSIDNIEWMTSLVSLKHLDMNFVNLSFIGSQWVEILNKHPFLIELYLANCSLFGSIPTPRFLNFTSLAAISLRANNFNSKFPEWLVNVSSLVYVDISYNKLYGRLPLGFSELPNLEYLDISGNGDLRGSVFQLLRKSWRKIKVLNLGGNNFHGSIPSSIGNLCHLRYLDLSSNHLVGNLPEPIKGPENCSSGRNPLPDLIELLLNNNQLTGNLPNWLDGLKNLVKLDLSNNNLEGPIPSSMAKLQNLEFLTLSGNKLNGSLPNSIGQLSELQTLDLSANCLIGSLTEKHFSNLTKLVELNINFNSFRLDVSPNWVPPFQVNSLNMASCHVGPAFPAWLQSQKNLVNFDLTNAKISSYIPDWFWNITFDMLDLTLSHNQLVGRLPDVLTFSGVLYVNFSYNHLEGPIPLSAFNVGLLDLSHNNFSGHIPVSSGESMSSLTSLTLSDNRITGPIPSNIGESMINLYFISLSGNRITGSIPDSIGLLKGLEVIDFSRNNLTGSIPSAISNCTVLRVLDLGSNSLSGAMPENFERLWQLKSLHLNHNNKISGGFPLSLQNLTNLGTLDLSYNNFSGKIPKWIGATFMQLSILSLRCNAFTGGIPAQLSNLSSLHVLDLAGNRLTGSIPPALGDLKGMVQEQNINRDLFHGYNEGYYYQERLDVSTKSLILRYTTTLSLVVSIDLSNNKFSGDFPKELTNLHGLVILNLSRNCITGSIPKNISRLHQLSSLDLSNNRLSGVIPQTMSSLTFLGYLNLSNNNFSGKIPFTGQMTTFDGAVFHGNPGLCGAPLVIKCVPDNPGRQNNNDGEDEDDNGFFDEWLYLSVGLGFAVGILGPLFALMLKRSWSEAYFNFVDEIVYSLGLERKRKSWGRRNHG